MTVIPHLPEGTKIDFSSDHRLLKLPEVCNIVGIGKTKIYAMVKEGEFPAPRKLGRSARWSSEKINAWLRQS